jgi:hypothetical protein
MSCQYVNSLQICFKHKQNSKLNSTPFFPILGMPVYEPAEMENLTKQLQSIEVYESADISDKGVCKRKLYVVT